jgi:hypothetical protein
MIVFIGTTRGTLRSHKTSVADLQDLRLTQILKVESVDCVGCSYIEPGPRSYDFTRSLAPTSCWLQHHGDFCTQLCRRLRKR